MRAANADFVVVHLDALDKSPDVSLAETALAVAYGFANSGCEPVKVLWRQQVHRNMPLAVREADQPDKLVASLLKTGRCVLQGVGAGQCAVRDGLIEPLKDAGPGN